MVWYENRSPGYEGLAHAIILQAVEDLNTAYTKHKVDACVGGDIKVARKELCRKKRLQRDQMKACMRFFDSEWCYGLSGGIEPATLKERVLEGIAHREKVRHKYELQKKRKKERSAGRPLGLPR